jgi:replication-associated recombination protein RarA
MKESRYKWDQVTTKHGYRADEVISAFQKSIRRGEEEDAVFFAYEMLATSDELAEKFWQRARVISVEDIGLADPS